MMKDPIEPECSPKTAYLQKANTEALTQEKGLKVIPPHLFFPST